MEYLIGAAIAGILIFLFIVKRKTDSFNQLSRLPFPAWHSVYSSSQMPETLGMARALILQTFHLAAEFGVLSQSEKKELDAGSMKEDPMKIVNEWFEHALPNVVNVIDERELAASEARLVGVFMLVSLKGVNPEGELRRFLQRFNH
ncbi:MULTISPECIES: hypothetical protein [unclassified Pseudomonas]|uniref:hypothetical protein n=1 Tax=unclassified Pseudomonas TaxID=196821 RepID=UPI000CAF2932|nr:MULTISPECIES: hypothetical protein [unclassified Pseudomonas]MBO0492372.1 hypothetical protein [Pseudomonas sp. Marseille-Q1929]PKQ39696.1 hypothetical protein CXP40_19140 [Pseudomonas sp. YY-1]